MEFELDGRRFRVRKLSAFGQLHLSRKVAPLLPPLAPLIVTMSRKEKKDPLSADLLTFAELAIPFADALASMKDQDAEQIFTMTLSSVDVQTSAGAWIPLWVPGAKSASEIELDDAAKLLPVVVRVIIHNLGNFTSALLTRHEEEIPASSGDISPAKKTG
jgi:hypothetical protein